MLASLRFLIPSLEKMLRRWYLTVLSETKSLAPMSFGSGISKVTISRIIKKRRSVRSAPAAHRYKPSTV